MPIVECKICKREFYAKPSWIERGVGKYCSRDCQHKGAMTGKFVSCFTCGEEVYKRRKALNHSKSGKYFCGKSCQTKWRNQEFVGARHGNWKGGEHIDYREILLKKNVKPICKLCKSNDSRVLCAHHLDKNRKNHKIENLVWLCRNCHHLVHNYNTEIK